MLASPRLPFAFGRDRLLPPAACLAILWLVSDAT